MADKEKPWYKKWWAITIFIIVGLMIIGSLASNNKTGSTQTQSNQQQIKTEEAQQPVQVKTQETKEYSLGDSIQAGDFKWKITDFSTTSQIGQDVAGTFFGEKANGIFLIVDLEVENAGNSAKYLTDSYLKLVDDQGREFSPNTMAAVYLKPQGSALVFEQLNPGITKKGKVVYDIPTTLKVAKIKITSNLLTSNTYDIKVNIG